MGQFILFFWQLPQTQVLLVVAAALFLVAAKVEEPPHGNGLCKRWGR